MVVSKRVIRALKGHGTTIGIDVELPDDAGIKDHAAKTIVVGQKRGANLTVQRELLPAPEPVERGLRTHPTTDEPLIFPRVVHSCSHKVDSHDQLYGYRHAVGAVRAEERRLRRRRSAAIQEENVRQAGKLGGKQKHREKNEVKNLQFIRHVIAHVDHEDVRQVRKANQRTQRRGARNEQQDATQHFRASRKHFIRGRSTHISPENLHLQEVAERPNKFKQIRVRHLRRDDFEYSVSKHQRG